MANTAPIARLMSNERLMVHFIWLDLIVDAIEMREHVTHRQQA
jgi:hypothetical protein